MKFMFSCREVHERASQFIDGESNMLTKTGVLMHILMCGNCRRFIKQLRLTVKTIQIMPAQQQINDEEDLDAMADELLTKHVDPKE